jgi:hypothetical protein
MFPPAANVSFFLPFNILLIVPEYAMGYQTSKEKMGSIFPLHGISTSCLKNG